MPSLKSLLLATATAISTTTDAQVSPCGGDFTDVEVQLYPTILTVGEDAYLYLSYSAPYQVDGGSTITSIDFNGMPYPDIDGKLCTAASDLYGESVQSSDDAEEPLAANAAALGTYYELGAVACPITAGSHVSNDSFSVPNMAGQLKSKVRWLSESGSLLLCLKFLITIEDAPAAAAPAPANNTDA